MHSICHGLVEDAGLVHITCSCCVHLRCATRFVEDTTTRGGISRVTCTNLALYSKRLDIRLFPILEQEQVRGMCQSTSGANRDPLRDRIAVAERFLHVRQPRLARWEIGRSTPSKRETRTLSQNGVDHLHIADQHELCIRSASLHIAPYHRSYFFGNLAHPSWA